MFNQSKKCSLRLRRFSQQYRPQFTHRPSPRFLPGRALLLWAGSTRSVKDDLFQQGVLT
jgi:hypothetical protein